MEIDTLVNGLKSNCADLRIVSSQISAKMAQRHSHGFSTPVGSLLGDSVGSSVTGGRIKDSGVQQYFDF